MPPESAYALTLVDISKTPTLEEWRYYNENMGAISSENLPGESMIFSHGLGIRGL